MLCSSLLRLSDQALLLLLPQKTQQRTPQRTDVSSFTAYRRMHPVLTASRAEMDDCITLQPLGNNVRVHIPWRSFGLPLDSHGRVIIPSPSKPAPFYMPHTGEIPIPRISSAPVITSPPTAEISIARSSSAPAGNSSTATTGVNIPLSSTPQSLDSSINIPPVSSGLGTNSHCGEISFAQGGSTPDNIPTISLSEGKEDNSP